MILRIKIIILELSELIIVVIQLSIVRPVMVNDNLLTDECTM